MKIKSAENININNILLLVAVYIGLDGLGLGLNMGGYNIMGVSIAHVLILLIVVFSLIFKNNKVFNKKNDLTIPIILLFGLFLIEFFISTIYVTLIESQYPMGQLIKNVLELYIYFLFFPIVLLISNKKQLMDFIFGIFILTIISAVICYYQSITKTSLSASTMKDYTEYIRFLFPTLELIAGTCFTIFAFYLLYGFRKKFIPMYLSGLLILPVLFIPLHRGVILSFLTILFLLLLLNFKNNLKQGFGLLVFLFFYFIITIIILDNIGVDFNTIWLKTKEGWLATLTQEGTAGFRFRLIKNAWKDTINNSPIFGIGFTWKPLTSLRSYLSTAFSRSPVNDSSYSSLITTFGLSGILVYTFLFYRLFKAGFKQLKHSISEDYRCIVIGILSLNAFLLLYGFSNNSLFGLSSTTIMVTSWAILYIIINFNREEKNGETNE